MTVVERKRSLGRGDRPRDQFPVGMRVLAVDDDPTSLKLLETLLLHCQYHVTMTSQAIMALKLLRENKDQFDLVISDVHMPDMDGFKLLELVGLEMDLPVIMLSANGETETVMKGITHGACDYLLKPVRIEELRNIWQHVLRRRKCDTTDGNNSNNVEDYEKAQIANSEGGQGSASNGVPDRDAKLNKKRKDQNEEDEDDCEENMNENEDPSAHTKPRVVWSVELHRKFVAAVNQLGIDKAVPKKILDLMNVERLTRENVASHLQKYRLYLKSLSAVASQANMAAAFGGRNPSYIPMGSLERFRNFHPLAGSRQLPALTPFQPNGVLGRMNSPTGFGQQRLVPSGTVQLGHIHSNTSSHINDLRKHQGIGLLGNPHGNNLQGMPTSMISEANTRFPGGFSGSGLAIGSSSNSFASITNNSLLFQGNRQHTLSGVLGDHSDVRMTSLSSDPFKAGLRDSSHLPDLGRCNDTWQVDVPSTKYSATNSLAATLSHNNVSASNIPNNVTLIISHMDSDLHDVSSGRVAVAPLPDPLVGNGAHPARSLGGSIMHMLAGGDESSNFLRNSKQNLDEQKQTDARNSNLIFNMNSAMPHLHANDSIADSLTMNTGFTNENTDMNLIGQTSGAPFLQQNCKTDFQLSYKEEFILGTTKLHGGFSSNACSFDDLVNGITKPDSCGLKQILSPAVLDSLSAPFGRHCFLLKVLVLLAFLCTIYLYLQ